jgi:hypothetical protein
MTGREGERWLGASEIGEFVYCARAWGLLAATEDAADPAAAALQAQGQPAGRGRAAAGVFAARRDRRESQRRGGLRAHRRHGRQVRLSRLLAGIGLLLLLLALAATLPALPLP